MTNAKSARQVLKSIGNKRLNLCKGEGYWYFIYDDQEKGIFETESVYTMRLSDMSLSSWVEQGGSFAKSVEAKHAGGQ